MTMSVDMMSDPVKAPTKTHTPIATYRLLLMSIRRELWEFRFVILAPLLTALLLGIGAVLGEIRLAHASIGSDIPLISFASLRSLIDGYAMMIVVSGVCVAFPYSLITIHNERRDRTILFWKSMPVSDTVTVLAKAAVPIIVMPLFCVVITLLADTLFIAIPLAVIRLTANTFPYGSFSPDWGHRLVTILTLLVTLPLWLAPVYGWFLLMSAWVRRAPFAVAVLVPIFSAIFERLALGTHWIGNHLEARFLTGLASVSIHAEVGVHKVNAHSGPLPYNALKQMLLGPELWGGLIVAALCIIAAIALRRRAEPI